MIYNFIDTEVVHRESLQQVKLCHVKTGPFGNFEVKGMDVEGWQG